MKNYKNILFWLLTGLIIFIPLYPKFPLLSVPGTYVAIRLEDFLISLVFVLWGIYQIKFNRSIIKEPLFQAFAVFWFVGIVSLLSAVLITHSVTIHLGILHWLRRVEFMLLFWVGATSITSWKQIKIIISVFIIVTFFVVLYGFGQIYLSFPVISTIDKDFSSGILSTLSPSGRVNSTFAGHYDLAIYLSYFLIIVGGLLFYFKKLKERIILIIIGILSFILLGFTAARVSFVATILGIFLVLLLLRKKAMMVVLVLLSVVIVIAVPQIRQRVIATVNVSILHNVGKTYTPPPTPTFSPQIGIQKQNQASEEAIANQKAKQGLPRDIAIGEPTNYTELEVGRSISIRTQDEWPRALRAFYKNPLLGTGYSSLSLAADNDYLRSLGETGILGFISLALIFMILLKEFFSKLKTKDQFKRILLITIFAIIIDVLITGTFIDILEASKAASLFWILAGIGWASVRLGARD